jgi:hypothetical protein
VNLPYFPECYGLYKIYVNPFIRTYISTWGRTVKPSTLQSRDAQIENVTHRAMSDPCQYDCIEDLKALDVALGSRRQLQFQVKV